MTAGYTPGPWKWRFALNDPYALEGSNGRDIIRPVDGMVYSEYSSDSATLELSSPEDGHLIAAAPDLYEALAAIVDEMTRGVSTGETRAAADAALAKARGEPS